MILFQKDGAVLVNAFSSVEEFREWVAMAGDEPVEIAYEMKMPGTAAGNALLSLCRIGNHDADGFEVLLENLLSEAFQAGINFAQRK
ncbi:MAG: hypothetical protein AAB473_04015 [Patescibacteria group bacterium]